MNMRTTQFGDFGRLKGNKSAIAQPAVRSIHLRLRQHEQEDERAQIIRSARMTLGFCQTW